MFVCRYLSVRGFLCFACRCLPLRVFICCCLSLFYVVVFDLTLFFFICLLTCRLLFMCFLALKLGSICVLIATAPVCVCVCFGNLARLALPRHRGSRTSAARWIFATPWKRVRKNVARRWACRGLRFRAFRCRVFGTLASDPIPEAPCRFGRQQPEGLSKRNSGRIAAQGFRV